MNLIYAQYYGKETNYRAVSLCAHHFYCQTRSTQLIEMTSSPENCTVTQFFFWQ